VISLTCGTDLTFGSGEGEPTRSMSASIAGGAFGAIVAVGIIGTSVANLEADVGV
jgi:hypothetical protein